MKVKDLVNVGFNKSNKQRTFSLKARALKKAGLTQESLLQLTIPKPRVNKFLPDQKGNKK